MARENSTMERIRADLLRRARAQRPRNGNEAQESRHIEQSDNGATRPSADTSRTRTVLSRLHTFPRSLTLVRGSQNRSSEDQVPKTPDSPVRPLTFSSSRYGEPGAPSSLPSPVPLSHIHEASPQVRPETSTTYPRGPHMELGLDTSNPFPQPTEHLYNGSNLQSSEADQIPSNNLASGPKPGPKRFMLCFPWLQPRRIQTQVIMCFVSGMFLASLLAVYLGLALTNHIDRGELTIMIILVILAATMFFCYNIVRLCILVSRGDRARRRCFPDMLSPVEYVVPPKPIHVVLARDEEAAGIESEAAKSRPPEYGRWRESVRVDPDRLFWQRNESVEPASPRPEPLSGSRPPSYASDDGISYVVEARPRSIAPPLQAHLATPPTETAEMRV